MRLFYTYLLIDPRTNDPFYIGKGLKDRMYAHNEKAANRSLRARIQEIKDANLNIQYEKWFESEDENFCIWMEIYLIDYFGRENLCNLGRGGENGPWQSQVGRRLSEIHRQAISASNKGKHSPTAEHLLKLTGSRQNPVTRQKMSENIRKAHERRRNSPQAIAQRLQKEQDRVERIKVNRLRHSERMKGSGNPFFGKSHSSELLERINAKLRGRPGNRLGAKMSEESKLKMRLAKLGKKRAPFSEQHKQRMSEAKIGSNNGMFGKTPWNKT